MNVITEIRIKNLENLHPTNAYLKKFQIVQLNPAIKTTFALQTNYAVL